MSVELSPGVTEASPTTRLRTLVIEHRGLLATFIGTFAFAGQTICVKLLKGAVPVLEVMCLRFLLQGIFSVMFGLFAGVPILFFKSRREGALLLARSIVGTVGMGLLYFALFNMSVGLANTIVYGAPAFVGIFGWIVLREKFQYRDIFLVFFNFTGIVLIAQPPFLFKGTPDPTKKTELIGVASAVAAMLFSAPAFILIRMLGLMNTSPVKIVFYFSICGTLVPACAGIAMQDWVIPPCGRARYILVLIGGLNFIAQSLISYGLACTKKSYFVSVVNSNQVPVTILLEIIILNVVPSWISLLGTCLVVGSALGVVFREGTLGWGHQEDDDDEQNEAIDEDENGRIVLSD